MEKEKNEGSITDNKEVDKRVLVVGKLKGTKPPKKKATRKTNKAKVGTKTTPNKKSASTNATNIEKTANSKAKSTGKSKTSNNAKAVKTEPKAKAETKKSGTKNTTKTSAKKSGANTIIKTSEKKSTTKAKTKSEVKKQTELKNPIVKVENLFKTSTKKEENLKATNGAEKVANKKEKIKIVEQLENFVNSTKKSIANQTAEIKKKNSKAKTKLDNKKIDSKAEKTRNDKKTNQSLKDQKNDKKTVKTGTKTKVNKTKKAMESISVLRVDIKSEEFREIAKNVIVFILVVALAISLIYIGNIGKENVSNKMLYSSLSKDIKMEELTEDGKKPTEAITTLKQENPEIQGWIKIEGTNINYPLLQGKDNEYYLTHNFKNEKTSYGSIYVNTNCDLKNDKSNVIIYGHDMKDGQMFSDLIKYADKEYYDGHKTIKITTEDSENEYTIVNVFKSKVFYKDEKNVFRFYQYYNLENEKQFKDYISNCKKLQLYDTGIEANYGDQLVTLITCEYSNENGRMVVVAKKN